MGASTRFLQFSSWVGFQSVCSDLTVYWTLGTINFCARLASDTSRGPQPWYVLRVYGLYHGVLADDHGRLPVDIVFLYVIKLPVRRIDWKPMLRNVAKRMNKIDGNTAVTQTMLIHPNVNETNGPPETYYS